MRRLISIVLVVSLAAGGLWGAVGAVPVFDRPSDGDLGLPQARPMLGMEDLSRPSTRGFFVENLGQWREDLILVGETGFGRIGFAVGTVYYDLQGGGASAGGVASPSGLNRAPIGQSRPDLDGLAPVQGGHVVRLSFVDGRSVVPRGVGATGHVSNYFHGNDPTEWVTGARSFSTVLYEGIWPGIDLRYLFEGADAKYELVVHPGADPTDINVRVEGAEVEVHTTDVQLRTSVGTLGDTGLLAFEEGSGAPVMAAFAAAGDGFSFALGGYDRAETLVIDPLVYSTYIGGNEYEYSEDLFVDSSGCVYVAGLTYSDDFPTSVGAYDTTFITEEGVLFKLDSTGTSLLFSTFIGGSDGDVARGIASDSSGNLYLTGSTASSDFPTTSGAYDRTLNTATDKQDAFILKMNPAGSTLMYSTYLGGDENDESGVDIAVGTSGNAYVLGETDSSDFPFTPSAYDRSFNGGWDLFVAKLTPSGSALDYATYFGGNDWDTGAGIALDSSGNAYITGSTRSSDLPTTASAIDKAINGDEGLIAKFDPSGSSLLYSTYIGGDAGDWCYGIATDPTGVYVTGSTASGNFRTTSGAYDETYNGEGDAFILKLDLTGVNLHYSSFLGGSGGDDGHAISVDVDGNPCITGVTASSDFPTTGGAHQRTIGGGNDILVTHLDIAGSRLMYSSYMGGSGGNYEIGEDGRAIFVDQNDDAYVIGNTPSTDFPTTSGAYDTSHNRYTDMCVFKTDMTPTLGPPSAIAHTTIISGDGFVELSWDPPGDDGGSPITGYKVYRGTASGSETLFGSVGADVLSYNDTAVTNGVTYYYQITAVNAKGEGPPSWEAEGTPLGAPPELPSAPRNLKATAGDGKVTLTWEEPADEGGAPITGYKLYRGTTSGGETLLCGLGVVLTYADPAVTNGQMYYYLVSATNSVGEGPRSGRVGAKPAAGASTDAPSEPLNLKCTWGDTWAKLTWDAPSKDGGSAITKYYIYRSDAQAGTYNSLGTVLASGAQGRSYTDNSVAKGSTYYYKVAAENGKPAMGPMSSWAKAMPGSASANVPSAPLNPVSRSGDGSVSLNWSAPLDDGGAAITGYRILRGTQPGGETHLADAGSVLTYKDTTVAKGTTYYYKVAAVNANGDGAASIEVTVELKGASDDGGGASSSMLLLVIVVVMAVALSVGVYAYMRRSRARAAAPARAGAPMAPAQKTAPPQTPQQPAVAQYQPQPVMMAPPPPAPAPAPIAPPPPAPASFQPAPVVGATGPAGGSRFCMSCGNPFRGDERFCMVCGKPR